MLEDYNILHYSSHRARIMDRTYLEHKRVSPPFADHVRLSFLFIVEDWEEESEPLPYSAETDPPPYGVAKLTPAATFIFSIFSCRDCPATDTESFWLFRHPPSCTSVERTCPRYGSESRRKNHECLPEGSLNKSAVMLLYPRTER